MRIAAELHVPVPYLFEQNDDLAALLRLVGHLPAIKLRVLVKALADG